MENEDFKTIEEMGYSVDLYNYLKRRGINSIEQIPKRIDYSKLKKSMLIELLTEHGNFQA